MSLKPLSADTSAEIEERQIERWREMSPVEKAAIVSGLTQTVIEFAKAGIRERHPGASAHEQRLRLAILLHGRDLAIQAYPEIDSLDSE